MHLNVKKGVKLYHEFYIDTKLKTPRMPEVVKIPLAAQDEVIKWHKTIGDSVEKYEVIASVKDEIPIYSPFSGRLAEKECALQGDGSKAMNYAVIKTVKDTIPTFPLWEDINIKSNDDIVNIAKKGAIVDDLRNQFFFYTLKGRTKYNQIIIDCVDEQPYDVSKIVTLLNYEEEVLKGAKLLGEIFGSTDIKLLICKNYITAKYLKIKNEDLEKIIVKGKYPKLPIIQKYASKNKGLRVSPGTCRALYRAAFFKEADLSRVVTLWGEGIKNPANIEMPFGITVKELLEQYEAFGMIERVVCGGVIKGYVASLSLPLNRSDTSITVMPLKKHHKTKQCINCGRCAMVCPYGLAPYYMLRKSNLNGVKRAKQLCGGMCDFCGACSYICPSRINLTEIIKDFSEKGEL